MGAATALWRGRLQRRGEPEFAERDDPELQGQLLLRRLRCRRGGLHRRGRKPPSTDLFIPERLCE